MNDIPPPRQAARVGPTLQDAGHEPASCKVGPTRAACLGGGMSFIGIDVAKATLDYACRPNGEADTAPNDDQGIRALVERLLPHEPTLVVLEATGGYEAAVVAALATAGLPVVVANPRQVRDFAKATGQLAKTDAIDADVLALFAERVRPAG